MTKILDGKATSLAIEAELTEAVNARLAAGRKRPHLAAVLVGDNPASRAYVGHKVKACARVGFESTLVEKAAEEQRVAAEARERDKADSIKNAAERQRQAEMNAAAYAVCAPLWRAVAGFDRTYPHAPGAELNALERLPAPVSDRSRARLLHPSPPLCAAANRESRFRPLLDDSGES